MQNASGGYPGADSQILGHKKTLARLKGDKEFLVLLYQTFLDELPKRQEKFTAALAENDLAALHKLAHSLKGAAGTIDAELVRERAFAVELSAKEGDRAKALSSFVFLEQEMGRLVLAMRAYVNA